MQFGNPPALFSGHKRARRPRTRHEEREKGERDTGKAPMMESNTGLFCSGSLLFNRCLRLVIADHGKSYGSYIQCIVLERPGQKFTGDWSNHVGIPP